jgi:hypothetical protein
MKTQKESFYSFGTMIDGVIKTVERSFDSYDSLDERDYDNTYMNSSQRSYYRLGIGFEKAMKGDNFLSNSLSGGMIQRRVNNIKGKQKSLADQVVKTFKDSFDDLDF